MFQLANFCQHTFMQEYWQKKPVLIRQAFTHFEDPLDEHELAGLAQESEIDSRIVSKNDGAWSVHEGPFDDFGPYCEGEWSLLVQGVDYWLPDADALMSAFDFVPNWRKDNLMVSFSNAGGSVGPHLDQYDVFIIQGKGRRRWKIGSKGQYQEQFPHPKLRQIDMFEADIDAVLEPGDMIYIPPGYPHEGVALEDCLNYSVGFRAPDQAQLFSSFADTLLDGNIGVRRYQDPELKASNHPALVTDAELNALKQLMKQALDDDNINTWLLSHISQKGADEVVPIEEPYSVEDIADSIAQQQAFVRSPGLKPIFEEVEDDRVLRVFIDGQGFSVEPNNKEDVLKLLELQVMVHEARQYSDSYASLLSEWVNLGFWLLQD